MKNKKEVQMFGFIIFLLVALCALTVAHTTYINQKIKYEKEQSCIRVGNAIGGMLERKFGPDACKNLFKGLTNITEIPSNFCTTTTNVSYEL